MALYENKLPKLHETRHDMQKPEQLEHIQKRFKETRNPDEIAYLVHDVFKDQIADEIFGTDKKFNGNARLVLMTNAIIKLKEPNLTLFAQHFGIEEQKSIAMHIYRGILVEKEVKPHEGMMFLEAVKKQVEEQKLNSTEVNFYSSSLYQNVDMTIKSTVFDTKFLKRELELLLKNSSNNPDAIVQREYFYRRLMKDARLIALDDYASLLNLVNQCFSAVRLTPIANVKKEQTYRQMIFGFLTKDYRPIELKDLGPGLSDADLAPPPRIES